MSVHALPQGGSAAAPATSAASKKAAWHTREAGMTEKKSRGVTLCAERGKDIVFFFGYRVFTACLLYCSNNRARRHSN